jgi:non-ribosomal peptide synthetase component F
VLWLATATEDQRLTLQRQDWLSAQVRTLLMRYGVPHETVGGVLIMFDSDEGIAALLDGA